MCVQAGDLGRQPELPEERRQGWQRHAAFYLHSFYRERNVLLLRRAPNIALLRLQCGPQAGAWLSAMPTDPRGHAATTAAAAAAVVAFGDHHAACTRAGLLARRAVVLEQAWVRVAREAVALRAASATGGQFGRRMCRSRCRPALAWQHYEAVGPGRLQLGGRGNGPAARLRLPWRLPRRALAPHQPAEDTSAASQHGASPRAVAANTILIFPHTTFSTQPG